MGPRDNPVAKYSAQRSQALLEDWANLPEPSAPDFKRVLRVLFKRFPEIFGELRGSAEVADQPTRDEDLQRTVWVIREHLRAVWDAPDLRHRDWYIFQLRALRRKHLDALTEHEFETIWSRLPWSRLTDGGHNWIPMGRGPTEQEVEEMRQLMARGREHQNSLGPTKYTEIPGRSVPSRAQTLLELIKINREIQEAQSEAQANPSPDAIDRITSLLERRSHIESLSYQKSSWEIRIEPPPPLSPFEQVMFHLQRMAARARHCANPDCLAPYFFAARKGQKYCSDRCAAPAQRAAKLKWWSEKGKYLRQRGKRRQGRSPRTPQ